VAFPLKGIVARGVFLKKLLVAFLRREKASVASSLKREKAPVAFSLRKSQSF